MKTAARRIPARLRQQQAQILARTDRIAARVGAIYSGLRNTLVSLLVNAGDDVNSVPLGAVRHAVDRAYVEVAATLHAEYPALARSVHRQTAAAMSAALPKKRLHHALRHRAGHREDVYDDELPFPDAEEMTDEEYRRAVEQLLFPSLAENDARRLAESPGAGGLTWEQRFRRYAASDREAILQQLAAGVSADENIRGLRKRVEEIVAGPRYKAERIARTEGRRIAEQAQREVYAAAGPALDGLEYLAVVDEASRPEHAALNGTIFYRVAEGSFVNPQHGHAPVLPSAPNCRCTLIPWISE